MRSLTSLELFFDSRDWFQRKCGFFSNSLIDSRWAFCGFSSFVNLSIICASNSWRSGVRLSSSDGSLRRNGRTIASGFELIVDWNPWAKIVNSPVVSRFSSTTSSPLKGTVGILSIECHSRPTRRIVSAFCFSWFDANYKQFQPEFRLNLLFIIYFVLWCFVF